MISENVFGVTHIGEQVHIFTIKNKYNACLEVLDYGCAIKALWISDKNNRLRDIVLGFDDVTGYEKDHSCLGECIGRCANRLKNGIITIDNKIYKLSLNCGKHHLHGGNKGFNRYIWDSCYDNNRIVFSRISSDGEEGYPGNLKVSVSYELTDENELVIEYRAVSDKDTVVNLTNHSYFNLDGVDLESVNNSNVSIRNHYLQLYSNVITMVDDESNQTGETVDIKDTEFDFMNMKRIGLGLDSDNKLIKQQYGYDINYELTRCISDKLVNVAKVYSQKSGINMDCYTNQPAVQLYTGNYLNDKKGKYGITYNRYSAICLETQGFPNAIENTIFPSLILRNGNEYRRKTVYKFCVQ